MKVCARDAPSIVIAWGKTINAKGEHIMRRQISWVILFFVIFIILLAPSDRAGANHPATQQSTDSVATLQLQPFLSGLSSPLYLTNAKDGTNRLFIVEQGGIIKVLQPGSTTPTIFLNITSRVLSGGERGLLGLAFHPQYETNRRFFVNYTRQTDGATVIAEYKTSTGNPNVADTTETVFLVIPQPFSNHNGGMIEFGSDGFLYIGMGDGGSANDPGNRAQNIDDLLGKMLRIDVDTPDGSVPYSSPSTNPFFGSTPGRDEIYAVGLRNPFRWSFDRATGQLLVGDVGQGAREEVDIVTLGGNYGWRVFEGTLCTNLGPPSCAAPGFTHTPPITEYSHSAGRCSITGGYAYRGTLNTLPTGAYIFGDFCTGEIFQFHNNVQSVLMDTALSISSFGEDEDGELYVVNLGGTIQKFVNTTPTCTFSINPTSQTFGAGGGTGGVAVTAPAGCNWTAQSNAAFITITAGASGSGNGTVNFSVAANTAQSSRTGTMTIAGQTFTVNQNASSPSCSFAINPSSQTFSSSGGTDSVNVTAPAGCNWTAQSNVAFITITAGASGSGNGVVSYSVANNSSSNQRSGTMTIAGNTFTVTQSGASCITAINPPSRSFSANGGSGSVSVSAPFNCSWTSQSTVPWINISSNGSGSGSKTLKYIVSANTSTAQRTGSVIVGGLTQMITQAGAACTFSINSTSQSFSSGGGQGSVGVLAPAGCNWLAQSNAAFITITAGSSGSGNGTVSYSVSANTSPSQRSGTMTIAGRTFTVTQSGAGGGCTFSINPTSQSFTSTGGSGAVNVSAGTGCAWTATSNAGFITITSGSSGSGSGSVNFSVQANSSASPRTGTMTVAGQTFTVTQSGVAGCTFSISPTSASYRKPGGSGTVSVTTGAGCNWTAVSNATWITVTSGSSGSGSGTVTYTVEVNNSGSTRTGTVTIAGKTLTVKQASF